MKEQKERVVQKLYDALSDMRENEMEDEYAYYYAVLSESIEE